VITIFEIDFVGLVVIFRIRCKHLIKVRRLALREAGREPMLS
jgi:hypothetical protein